MLLSPYFDSENLICEEIVIKMGLPIFDRKCETVSISGIKTEAVGFVKTNVQCLKMVSNREQSTSRQRLSEIFINCLDQC